MSPIIDELHDLIHRSHGLSVLHKPRRLCGPLIAPGDVMADARAPSEKKSPLSKTRRKMAVCAIWLSAPDTKAELCICVFFFPLCYISLGWFSGETLFPLDQTLRDEFGRRVELTAGQEAAAPCISYDRTLALAVAAVTQILD